MQLGCGSGRRAAALLGTLAALCSCQASEKPGKAKAPSTLGKGQAAIDVVTMEVVPQDLPMWLEAIGTVTPLVSVAVEPQVDGRLMSIDFVEGQHVQQNQVLARIDPRPFVIAKAAAQAALTRDRATLANLERNVTRLHQLREKNMVSEQQLGDQRASVAALAAGVLSDQAALDDASLKLEYATIRAPVAGTVGLKRIDRGNLVRAGSGNALVSINQLSPIGVVFSLPQQDLPALQRALAEGPRRVEVLSRDEAGPPSEGEVSLVDNQIDAKSGTIRLKAVVANAKEALWPNQFVRVRVLLNVLPNAWAVPASAVVDLGNETFVYVAKEERAHKVAVKVAFWRGADAILREPLAIGPHLIVEGHHRLKDGDAISARAASQPPRGLAPASSPTKGEQATSEDAGGQPHASSRARTQEPGGAKENDEAPTASPAPSKSARPSR